MFFMLLSLKSKIDQNLILQVAFLFDNKCVVINNFDRLYQFQADVWRIERELTLFLKHDVEIFEIL